MTAIEPTKLYDLLRDWGADRVDQRLPRPLVGLLLYFNDGETALIGDMNEMGGVCDDCSHGGTVVAYERVWREAES